MSWKNAIPSPDITPFLIPKSLASPRCEAYLGFNNNSNQSYNNYCRCYELQSLKKSLIGEIKSLPNDFTKNPCNGALLPHNVCAKFQVNEGNSPFNFFFFSSKCSNSSNCRYHFFSYTSCFSIGIQLLCSS